MAPKDKSWLKMHLDGSINRITDIEAITHLTQVTGCHQEASDQLLVFSIGPGHGAAVNMNQSGITVNNN